MHYPSSLAFNLRPPFKLQTPARSALRYVCTELCVVGAIIESAAFQKGMVGLQGPFVLSPLLLLFPAAELEPKCFSGNPGVTPNI